MAENAATQKRAYPLPVYNYRVTVGGESAAFSEVTGIAVEYGTVTYRHGFSEWEGETITRFKSLKHIPVTLKRGTVAGRNFLEGWLTESPPQEKPLAISLCDEAGNPVVVWRIAAAIPTKLTAPVFDANSSQVSIETLELMVSGVSMEHV